MLFGKKSQVCRRKLPREEVTLAGSALAVTRSRSVVISDVSADGAALGGRDLPRSGDDLFIVVGSLDRLARVVWHDSDRCGVRFDQPVSQANIEQMKKEAGWASVTGWAS